MNSNLIAFAQCFIFLIACQSDSLPKKEIVNILTPIEADSSLVLDYIVFNHDNDSVGTISYWKKPFEASDERSIILYIREAPHREGFVFFREFYIQEFHFSETDMCLSRYNMIQMNESPELDNWLKAPLNTTNPKLIEIKNTGTNAVGLSGSDHQIIELELQVKNPEMGRKPKLYWSDEYGLLGGEFTHSSDYLVLNPAKNPEISQFVASVKARLSQATIRR